MGRAERRLSRAARDGAAAAHRATLLPQLCDWTKRQGALLRGATEGTHLQNDGYDFLNLGYYLERGDNTARLLDVKYYVLLPTTDMVGGSIDTYQWTTLLRALSAYRAFHWSYGGEYSPRKIAHFLILNRACPRSLLHCQTKVEEHLGWLAKAYGTGRRRTSGCTRCSASSPRRRSRTSSRRGCTSS